MTDAAEARRALGALLSSEEGQFDLPRAALLIAAEEYPDLDSQVYLDRIAAIGQTLRQRIQPGMSPWQHVELLNGLLLGEHGLRGNTDNYYDPRNSYLNEVLDRRLGIPITLALVYIAVGRQAGLPLSGVGFPAHFLVAYEADPRLLMDPFNHGRLLSLADCQTLLHQLLGASGRLEPAHLAATPPRQFLLRLVTNLKVAYQRSGDLRRALRASEQLSLVHPSADELRERGMLRFRLTDFAGATADLERYLGFEPAAPDAEAVRRQLALIRELRERRN